MNGLAPAADLAVRGWASKHRARAARPMPGLARSNRLRGALALDWVRLRASCGLDVGGLILVVVLRDVEQRRLAHGLMAMSHLDAPRAP